MTNSTEARQDELAGIKPLKLKNEYGDFYDWCQRLRNGQIDEDTLFQWIFKATFALPVSSGGGVCPECKGKKRISDNTSIKTGGEYVWTKKRCPTCNGTGQKQPKTVGEIIKEWKS